MADCGYNKDEMVFRTRIPYFTKIGLLDKQKNTDRQNIMMTRKEAKNLSSFRHLNRTQLLKDINE